MAKPYGSLLTHCVLLVLGACFTTTVIADPAEDLFVRGNDFYQAGDYASAGAEYQKILDLGYESWEVFYNLGNCFHKQGDLAHAILNFERAKRLKPLNEDIEFNLELANLGVVDRVQELPKFFLAEWLSKSANFLSVPLLVFLTLGTYFLMNGLVVLRIFPGRRFSGKGATTVLVTCVIFVTIIGSLLAIQIYQSETNIEAVVLSTKVDVKSAPDEAGTDVFTLHQGVKVGIVDRSLSWIKIRLADGKVGWMPQEGIEVI